MSCAQKKKRNFLLLLVFLTAFLILTAAVFFLRPDWRFVATEAFVQMSSHADLEPVTPSDLSDYSLDELRSDPRVTCDQSLLLINPDWPLEEDFTPEIDTYGDTDLVMNLCVMEPYETLSQAVQERFNETLYIKSAYRTAEEQREETVENAENAAQVGSSEHQAGLGLDVYVPYYAGNSFIKTEAGQYVDSHCWEYGFIVRYPYYGTAITGIPYEPWHLRYVGAPHAELIYKNQLTLEEYLDWLEVGSFYEYNGYLISRQEGETFQLPAEFESAVISPDHEGNQIITVKYSSAES